MFEDIKNEAIEAKSALTTLTENTSAEQKTQIKQSFIEKTKARQDAITSAEQKNDPSQTEALARIKSDFEAFQNEYTSEMKSLLKNIKIEVVEITEGNNTELFKLGSEVNIEQQKHIDNIEEIIIQTGANHKKNSKDNLEKGMTGLEVKAGIKTLQNYLNETYNTNLVVDGILGRNTTAMLLSGIPNDNNKTKLQKMLDEKPIFTKVFDVEQSKLEIPKEVIYKKIKELKEKFPTFVEAQKKTDKDFAWNRAKAIIEDGKERKRYQEIQKKRYNKNKIIISKNILTQTHEDIKSQDINKDSLQEDKDTNKIQTKKEYVDWDDIMKKNIEINKLSNTQKIIEYNKKKGTKPYAIVDKKKGVLYVYEHKSGKILFSSNIDLGANKSDAQTVTKIKDKNGDGIISQKEAESGIADFSKGNKSTGAGKFYISNIDSNGYGGLPLLNMMNEQQYENYKNTNKIENVATSFHKGYQKDNKNRVSNGCIRCDKETLDNLIKHLNKTSEVYILPEDDGNNFVYENGKLNFKVNSKKNYNEYKDKQNTIQKGQGINRSINTLNYIPIKLYLDGAKFKSDNFTSFDFDDEQEYKNVKAFVKSLEDNKKNIMKAAKINGDIYNEIAKITFGIFGTESNFADTHSETGNLMRAGNKRLSPSNSSSPDYYAKYHTYGAVGNNRSVGMTQIRWSHLNEDEKKALAKVNITENKAFMNPTDAALGTAIILGIRYNQQLTSEQKKEIRKYLPTKWNVRKNYADRVKKNSKYLTIKQLEQ